METHIIPNGYYGPYTFVPSKNEDNGFVIEVRFTTMALAEEWMKQRIMADEIAVELEEYNE